MSSISTRVRVNSYTNVHAVAELTDGKLYVVKTYVKASGGCSAPATKSADKAGIGEMRFRQFARSADAAAGNLREAVVMIRHPNNSGLQMDQLTRLYLPAYFVQSMKVFQGEELLLAMDGSISISEDPNIRFSYVPSNCQVGQRRGGGHRQPRVQGRMAGRRIADVVAIRRAQKQRTPASACARRKSLVADLTCSGDWNMEPNRVGTCDRLKTVSAAT